MSPPAVRAMTSIDQNKSYYFETEMQDNKSIFKFFKKPTSKNTSVPASTPSVSNEVQDIKINSPKVRRMDMDLTSQLRS